MENCKCYDLICNGQILGPETIMEMVIFLILTVAE